MACLLRLSWPRLVLRHWALRPCFNSWIADLIGLREAHVMQIYHGKPCAGQWNGAISCSLNLNAFCCDDYQFFQAVGLYVQLNLFALTRKIFSGKQSCVAKMFWIYLVNLLTSHWLQQVLVFCKHASIYLKPCVNLGVKNFHNQVSWLKFSIVT